MKIRPVVKKDIPQIIELIGDVRAEYDCTLDVEREETYLLAPGEYFRARGGESTKSKAFNFTVIRQISV